jgi:hydrogenase maturation protease
MQIRILGLGNVLMADDGFGPYVIEALNAVYEFPPDVTVLDVGTPGLDLTPYLMHADKVIVVDTVRSDGPAGTIRLYRRDEILRHAPQPRLGPHDPGLKETLLALDFDGSGPSEVLLVGVIPGRTEARPFLTDAVRAAVPDAMAEVVRELDRLGATPSPRPRALPVAPWWEREILAAREISHGR